MTKTVFVTGQELEAAYLNAIQNLQFDGLDLDGHYPKLVDAFLSDDPTAIKSQWQGFRDTFLVTSGAGLSVNYTGGTISLGNLTKFTVASGSLVVPNNSTVFIYISESGVVSQSTILPVRCVPIARLTTVAGAISGAIEDLRPRYQIAPRSNAIPVFGSGGYEGDLTISSNTTLSGQKFVRNFTLNTGITLTVDPGFLYVQASGDITINGNISAVATVAGGRGFNGTPVTMQYLADSGIGFGGGAGHNGVVAKSYSPFISPLSSGGAAGFGTVSLAGGSCDIITSKGGNGGGTIILEAAGSISINGTILCNGSDGIDGSATNITGSPIVILTGGGGGAGGLVLCKSLNKITVAASAQISCNGGNGANGKAYNAPSSSSGGGAGAGGGWINFFSPNTNTSGAILTVNGGNGGLGANTANPTGIGGSIGASFGGLSGVASRVNGNSGSVGQIQYNSFAPV